MFFIKIKTFFEEHPLGVSLALAFFLRSTAAFLNYGPAALDDYNNIIGPTLRLLQTNEHPNIPSLRFEILPYLLFSFIYPFYLIGIDTPQYLVSIGYFFLGLISLFQIYGAFRLGDIYLSPLWRNLYTLVMATHFISPFLATRAYLGVFAMTSFIWGLYFSEKKKYYLSGFLIAITIFFRFTLAPLYLLIFLYLFYRKNSTKRLLPYYFLGGLSTVCLMILSEVLTGHAPFETSMAFLEHNLTTHVQSNAYGTMPWLSYFGILLCIFIPPISLLLVRPFFIGAKKLSLPLIAFLGIFIPHFLLPYKLGRFLIPVLPLFILMTIRGLEILNKNKLYLRAFQIFLIMNLPLALMISVSGSEMSSVNGLIHLRKQDGKKLIHNVYPLRWGYYGYDREYPDIIYDIDKFSKNFKKSRQNSFYLLNFMSLSKEENKILKQNGIDCEKKQVFKPSFFEEIFIKLNPKFNNRRRETVLYYCQ